MTLKERIRTDIAKNRERIRQLGPGIVTGGAGNDPAGIVTYTVVGATTGFSQLWLLLLSTPMMIAIQNGVARIAIVTGKSLPEITTAYYSRKVTIFMVMVLAVANILTIGADLNAVAAILHILTGYETIYFLVPITALIVYLILFGKYRTIRNVLIALTAILAVYIVSAVMLYGKGADIQDVTTLAQTLKPAAGGYAFALFSLGIVVAGLLAIPVLAGSTAYAVANTFGWREGMDNRVSDAKGFYFVFCRRAHFR